jgi:OOP family OmpA-OmpF porin
MLQSSRPTVEVPSTQGGLRGPARRRRVRDAVIAVVTTLSAVAGVGPAAASSPMSIETSTTPTSTTPTSPTSSDAATGALTDIPVAGSFRYSALQRSDDAEVVGVVHAVRRVPGGTAVYYSVGTPDASSSVWIGTQPNAGLGRYGPYDLASVAVVDTAHLQYYTPMQSGGTCLCSQTTDLQSAGESGVFYTGYAILPELPPDVTSVGVNFGFGAQVEDVPVQDGPLTPTADGGSTFSELGKGWPALPDESVVSSVTDPASYVLPLTRQMSDLERSVTTKESPDSVEVDLAADVLFAVDKSTLSPAASAKLADVAEQITERGTGTVTVVGYTDSTGSTSHNSSLSRARAAAVLTALKPMVTKKGIRFSSTGKGESDPVADNSTKEGRRLNRRVTISFEVAT